MVANPLCSLSCQTVWAEPCCSHAVISVQHAGIKIPKPLNLALEIKPENIYCDGGQSIAVSLGTSGSY